MEFLDSVSGPGFQFWVLSMGRAQQGGEMLSLVTKGGQANCGWAGGSLPAEFLRHSSGGIVPARGAGKAPLRSWLKSQAEEG